MDESGIYYLSLRGKLMFTGVSSLRLDHKGRLAIPAKYRELLTTYCVGKLVLTVDPAGCLLLYPDSEWQPVRDRLSRLSGLQAQIRRIIVGHAEELEMDKAGRISITPRLRHLAALEKEIAFVGIGNKFEIWDDARWMEKTRQVFELDITELESQMQGIVL